MKGSSTVIMGATLAMVVILAFVLVLVLVLLAELYCSLLRRRKLTATKPGSSLENPSLPQAQQAQDHHSLPSPLGSFYAQGVLDASRSFLFPKLPSKRRGERRNAEADNDVEKQKHGKLHELLRTHSPTSIGLRSSSTSPSPTYISASKPPQSSHEIPKPEIEAEAEVGLCGVEACHGSSGGGKGENLMYISNPIYNNDVTQPSRADTPFETPGSSPAQLDLSGSSGKEEREINTPAQSSPGSLPLTPMKRLPPKAGGSVGMKDARSNVGTCGSESNNSQIDRSSSSGSPCSSPSW